MLDGMVMSICANACAGMPMVLHVTSGLAMFDIGADLIAVLLLLATPCSCCHCIQLQEVTLSL